MGQNSGKHEGQQKGGVVSALKRVLYSRWTRWLVSFGLLSALLAISDLGLIGKTIAKAQWAWLLAGFLMAMLLTAYGGIKWWVLMPRSRAAPLVFVRVNFVSNFVGIFFPGIIGIEAARIAGITRSSRDFPAAFSSVIVDRIFGLMTLAITVVLGGLVATTVVPEAVTLVCTLALVALLGGIVLVMSQRCRSLLSKVLPWRVNSALSKFYECLDLYKERKGTLVLSLFLSLVFQGLRVVMVYCLARSLFIDVSFAYLIVVVPVALFVQMLPVSIYGIGIRESAMVAMLGVAGVSTESAISLSILMLAVQIGGSFPGGLLFAMGHRLDTPPKDTVQS